jgi:hypothetical protein
MYASADRISDKVTASTATPEKRLVWLQIDKKIGKFA